MLSVNVLVYSKYNKYNIISSILRAYFLESQTDFLSELCSFSSSRVRSMVTGSLPLFFDAEVCKSTLQKTICCVAVMLFRNRAHYIQSWSLEFCISIVI